MKHDSRVLIVEDDPAIARLIGELLEEASCASVAIGTGMEALRQVEQHAFDLVILDWMLPDIHGDTLCRAIKARYADTFLPVLMLTARGELSDRIAGLEAGADDYLIKPFHADELLARARALLRIRVAEAERSDALKQLVQQHDELQEAYNQLRAAQAQLLQTYKLAALGELVAGVAHELNNPLAIILGNAELLPELADEQDRRAVAQIISGAQRARRVVQSLTTFARRGMINENWHDPREIVEHMLDLRRAALRTAGIQLEVIYAASLPMLWVDGPQMQQVLLNLIMNAEQALLGQPRPRIALYTLTQRMPVGAPPVLPDLAQEPESTDSDMAVVFDVADNGPGLDEQIRSRVFEPFVTTKSAGQSTGLSLAISYGIVAQHGGSLQFSSEPGRGTTFRISMPVQRPPALRPPGDIATEAVPACGNVIVIDDEPTILDLVRRILSRRGYSISVASSARLALQMIQHRAYDAILCDIKMPDMDGITFYKQFTTLQLAHQPRVIIMTGDTSNAETDSFLRRNKLEVLHKPFNGKELLAALAAPAHESVK